MKAVINNCLHHYIDIGISTATPVIFIHGFPFSHKMWTFAGGQTESIATTYRVIAYDIRGHGDSEIGDGQFTLEMFVDDLFGLMDHLNITRAVLVGFSMGGYIALRAAEKNPDRMRALVLCDTRSEADSNEAKLRRAANIKAINELSTQSIKPDLTILLDTSTQKGLSRKQSKMKDRFETEEIAFHNRVRDGYLRLAAQEPERWLVIDATLTKAKIGKIIWDRVNQLLQAENVSRHT